MSDNGITLDQAIQQRNAWLACSLGIAGVGQEYTMQDGPNLRKFVRADLKEVNTTLALWEQRVRALTPGRRRRVRYGVPE